MDTAPLHQFSDHVTPRSPGDSSAAIELNKLSKDSGTEITPLEIPTVRETAGESADVIVRLSRELAEICPLIKCLGRLDRSVTLTRTGAREIRQLSSNSKGLSPDEAMFVHLACADSVAHAIQGLVAPIEDVERILKILGNPSSVSE